MSDDELSSYAGSASEAEEVERQRGSRPDDEVEEKPADEQEAPKRTVVPRRPKLDADRILDNAQGINRVFDDFPKIKFRPGSEVANLDLLMQHFNVWAGQLYPYGLSLQDFARTCENELYPERHRRRVFELRARYVKREAEAKAAASSAEMMPETPDAEEVAQQAELAARMEENRRRAIEKRKQRELESHGEVA